MKRSGSFGRRGIARVFQWGLVAAAVIGFTAPAAAQWPSSYASAFVLGGGPNVRAGDILPMANGGVICCFDTATSAGHRLRLVRIGESVPPFVPDGTAEYSVPAERVKIGFAAADPESYIYLTSQHIRTVLQVSNLTDTLQYIKEDGSLINFIVEDSFLMLAGCISEAHTLDRLMFNPWSEGLILQQDKTLAIGPYLPPGSRVREVAMASAAADFTLTAYTLYGPQTGTPTQVWLSGINRALTPPKLIGPVRLDNQGTMRQEKATLTAYSAGVMATWIAQGGGPRQMYAKLLGPAGEQLSSAKVAMENVVDFTATSSTLGIPVFAAVLRNPAVYPFVDLLAVGLINPENGGTLAIPVAASIGVKVKLLRQAADGNFRLVYSMPENGTVRLKVRCISGTTGGTLWETTVADLGIAADGVVEEYPNTFIAGDGHSALFIMTRYDEPGTAMSYFKLVRLLPNGTLG